jgi:hypothetical protein
MMTTPIFCVKEYVKQETSLFFDPEDGGHMILWNIRWFSMEYVLLHSRK